MNIVLALYNVRFAQQLKKSIEEKGAVKVLEIVSSEEDLLEFVSNNNQIDGILVTSDLAKKIDDLRLEVLVDVLMHIRKNHPEIQLTMFSNEAAGHPMLAELVEMGLYNIFIKGTGDISTERLINSFVKPATFSDALVYREVNPSIPWRKSFANPTRTIIEIKNDKKPLANPAPQVEIPVNKTREEKTIAKINEIKPEIIVKESVIEKEVEKIRYMSTPSKIIVVGSLYRGAGSTLLSTNLALMLARRSLDVSYIEHPLIPVPYMFDYLQIHANEKNTPYVDALRQIAEEGVLKSGKIPWVEKGVKWHPIDTRKMPLSSFSFENLLTVSRALQSSVLILDISNCWLNPEIQQFLYLADQVLVCVDTDPIKLDRISYHSTKYKTAESMTMDFLLQNEQIQFDLVVMKDHEAKEQDLLQEILPKEPIASFPYISYPEIQEALYDFKLLYEYEEYQELFEETLAPFLKNILPSDFLAIKQSRKTFFQKLRVKNR